MPANEINERSGTVETLEAQTVQSKQMKMRSNHIHVKFIRVGDRSIQKSYNMICRNQQTADK